MKIDLDFDFDYLRIHFYLNNMFTTFYVSKKKAVFCQTLDLHFNFSITNNDFSILNSRELGFCFDNECEKITISTWNKHYDFDIPLFFFVSKTKEYVDHFNWIKEAYVS